MSQQELVDSKLKVLKLLKEAGFSSLPNIKVYSTSNHKCPDVYGYYESNSQFKGRLKISVCIRNILKKYKDCENRKEQIVLTIVHEFAHSLVEAIEYYQDKDPFHVPDWKSVFNKDEELFAETFALCLVSGNIREYLFFKEFLPSVAECYKQALKD